MSTPQLELIKTPTPEERVRENLERAMIRYAGNIQAYYAELLKKVPPRAPASTWSDLQRIAAFRLRAAHR